MKKYRIITNGDIFCVQTIWRKWWGKKYWHNEGHWIKLDPFARGFVAKRFSNEEDAEKYIRENYGSNCERVREWRVL